MSLHYDKRSIDAIAATKFVADSSSLRRHAQTVLGSNDLLQTLQRLRADGRTSNADVGRLLGLASSRVAEIFDGKRRVTLDEAKTIVEHFGLSPDQPPTHSSDSGDAAAITSLDLSLSMGPGTLIEDFIEAEPVLLDLGLLQAITRTPSDRLRLVKGIGDSMEPTLRTGDRILVDINDRQLARINGIYWIDHYGAHGIKRLRMAAEGRVMIISDNKDVPDFEVDLRELRIEGRVIWFGREL